MRRILALPALLIVAGCGSQAATVWARPQTVRIGERPGCRGLAVAVSSLRITGDGWTVSASVENRSGRAVDVLRPHVHGGTYFGLAPPGVVHPGLLARRFTPPLPRRLEAGARWSGSFTGLGRVASGVPLRVVLGRFTPAGAVVGFVCTTDHSVRLY